MPYYCRGTLNAVPLNVSQSSTGMVSVVPKFQSIDEMCINEENEEDDEHDDESKRDCFHPEQTMSSAATSMSATICHCRQLIPFHILPNDFEQQCCALFQAVYHRSCMGFNSKTKVIEIQVIHNRLPIIYCKIVYFRCAVCLVSSTPVRS